MLVVVVGFGDHHDFLAYEEGRVEPHSELPDQVDFVLLQGREVVGGSRFGHRPQVLHQLRLRHAHSRVSELDVLLLLVDIDPDLEILVVAEQGRVGEGREPDLVECVGGVGNDLPEEDLLLGVEGVDEDVHESG